MSQVQQKSSEPTMANERSSSRDSVANERFSSRDSEFEDRVKRMVGRNTPQEIYWTVKLHREGRPLNLRSTMVKWDEAIGRWHHMEDDHKLVELFGHDGSKCCWRKVLSYSGKPNGEDQGNWVYAVCLRHMLCLCTPNDWRYVGTQHLNDDSAGDVLRAIWGLLYHRQCRISVLHCGEYLADGVPESEIPTKVLQEYCCRMTRVVMLLVDMWPRYFREDERPTSKSMAADLI